MEGFEFFVAPKRVECAPEAFDDMGCFDFAQFDGPFNPVFECGPGQIRRTDVDGAESVIPLEKARPWRVTAAGARRAKF